MTDEPVRPAGIEVPASGFVATRIGLEFGSTADFADSFERALVRGGEQGVTLVAALDRGDLAMHLPRVDGPCWNSVPLFHLRRDEQPSSADWATTSAILEKLERYR